MVAGSESYSDADGIQGVVGDRFVRWAVTMSDTGMNEPETNEQGTNEPGGPEENDLGPGRIGEDMPVDARFNDDASVGMAMPEDMTEGSESGSPPAAAPDGESDSASDDGFSTMTGESVGGEGPDSGAGIDIDMSDTDGPDLETGN
jgi:hypothetical protein